MTGTASICPKNSAYGPMTEGKIKVVTINDRLEREIKSFALISSVGEIKKAYL